MPEQSRNGDLCRLEGPLIYGAGFQQHKPLGTAGPLWLARNHFQENEFFILMNGDILTKLDFSHFLDAGRKNNWDLTLGYTKYVYRSPFGVLSIVDGVVQGITEKPSHEYPISAGIY